MCPTHTVPAKGFTVDVIFEEGDPFKKWVSRQTEMLVNQKLFDRKASDIKK